MNCGHHGIWGKGNGTRPQNMYDTSVKVPCIMSQPGRIAPARVSDALLSGYDVFPTLLDYLDLAVTTPRAASPDAAFARCSTAARSQERSRSSSSTTNTGLCAWFARANGSTFTATPTGRTSCSTSCNDPGERRNLVDDPSANSVKEELRARLEDWFRIYVDPRRDGIDKGVTGCGQLGRVEDADAAHPMFADRHLVGADWDLWVAPDDARS